MASGLPCAAPGTSCGTASGWRKGGRCPRCRAAHNAADRQRRGISSEQRDGFLAALNAGAAPAEAAAQVGVSIQSVQQQARSDGGLRAALDGMPPAMQQAARMGDWLAALTRAGGDEALAVALSGVDSRDVEKYIEEDARFERAAQATRHWLASLSVHTDAADSESVLRREWAAGTPQREIGLLLGVSQATVHAYAYELGLPPRREVKLSDEQQAWLRQAWTENRPLTEIMRELELSDASVRRYVRTMGLPARAGSDLHALSEEQLRMLREAWDAGRGRSQIAESLGVTTAVVSAYVRDLGLLRRTTGRPGLLPAEAASVQSRTQPGDGELTHHLSGEEEAVLRREWAAGTSQHEIAKMLRMDKKRVVQHAHALGLTPRDGRPTDVETLTLAEIGRELGSRAQQPERVALLEMRRLGIEPVGILRQSTGPGTALYDADEVRAARRAGGLGPAGVAHRRMTESAEALGYASIDAYFAARAGVSGAELARELGVPRQTAIRWRDNAEPVAWPGEGSAGRTQQAKGD